MTVRFTARSNSATVASTCRSNSSSLCDDDDGTVALVALETAGLTEGAAIGVRTCEWNGGAADTDEVEEAVGLAALVGLTALAEDEDEEGDGDETAAVSTIGTGVGSTCRDSNV